MPWIMLLLALSAIQALELRRELLGIGGAILTRVMTFFLRAGGFGALGNMFIRGLDECGT
jgi:hypothetical protein